MYNSFSVSLASFFIQCVCVFIIRLYSSMMELGCHGNRHNKAAGDKIRCFEVL